MHYCGLAIERSECHHRLMSCTKSYGKSELLMRTTSFKKIWRAGKYPRLTKIQLKLIPVFHFTIPFHCSIPLIPDSHALEWLCGYINIATAIKGELSRCQFCRISACCPQTLHGHTQTIVLPFDKTTNGHASAHC